MEVVVKLETFSAGAVEIEVSGGGIFGVIAIGDVFFASDVTLVIMKGNFGPFPLFAFEKAGITNKNLLKEKLTHLRDQIRHFMR